MSMILVWILNAVALLAVAYLLPGITVASFGSALIAALVLGLVNMLVKPVLVLLTLPITIVTLGLFLIVINALLFWFVGSVLKGFQVNGFWWAVGSDPLQHHLRPADQADPQRGGDPPEALCASPQGHACGPAEPDPRHPDGEPPRAASVAWLLLGGSCPTVSGGLTLVSRGAVSVMDN